MAVHPYCYSSQLLPALTMSVASCDCRAPLAHFLPGCQSVHRLLQSWGVPQSIIATATSQITAIAQLTSWSFFVSDFKVALFRAVLFSFWPCPTTSYVFGSFGNGRRCEMVLRSCMNGPDCVCIARFFFYMYTVILYKTHASALCFSSRLRCSYRH